MMDGELPSSRSAPARVLPVLSWFWPVPVRPGLYGAVGGNRMLLTTNNARRVGEIIKTPGNEDAAVLVIEAGGYPADAAVAFQTVTTVQVITEVQQISLANKEVTVEIPPILAGYLGLKNGQLLGDAHISVSNSFWHGYELQDPGSIGKIITRLGWAVRLWFGQALIFTIPLLLYGPMAWLVGIGLLGLSAIVLALCWDITRLGAVAKGAIAGVMAAGVFMLAAYLINGLLLTSALFTAGVMLLAFVWMGFILAGAQH